MSVYWYDTSIVNKIREITGDDRVAIVPTDTLFRYVASLKDDEVKPPLIAITRLGYTLSRRSKSPLTSSGYPIGRSIDNSKTDSIQAIPIQINYQLDVITRNRDSNDELVDELIFWFINHPTMDVSIGKGANVTHKFSIFFNEDIEDTSEIESHMSRGEYFRTTMTFYVSDAYLWKTTKALPNKRISPITLIGTEDIDDRSKDFMKETINIKENE